MSYKGVLFICPMVNGVIADGHTVLAPTIENCQPVGKIFTNDRARPSPSVSGLTCDRAAFRPDHTHARQHSESAY